MKEKEMVTCQFDGTEIMVPRDIFLEVVFRAQTDSRKYLRYKEGAKMFSLRERSFNKLAHEAGAVSKLTKTALVNVELVDKYLSECRL